MQAIKCEVCGSGDLIKQEGVFVCQHCGTKYTLDEVRNLLGTVKIDNSDQAVTFREMAFTAYNSGNTEEAYTYFLKTLEIEPDDYRCIFYKGMCQGWKTTLAKPRVEEAFAAFSQAIKMLPDEKVKEESLEYISELIRLMNAWYQLAYDRFLETNASGFYSSNISVFWDYQSVCLKIVELLDPLVSFILAQGDNSIKNRMGTLYCGACTGMCLHVIQYLDYSQNNIRYIGHNKQFKQKYIDKNDNMVFEIRKINPSFGKLVINGKQLSGMKIDRLDPPEGISTAHIIHQENEKACEIIDKQIDDRVEKWRKEEEVNKKRTQYWTANPEKEKAYKALKEKMDSLEATLKEKAKIKRSAETDFSAIDNELRSCDESIKQGEAEIAKLERKLFGKAKNQEQIQQILDTNTRLRKKISTNMQRYEAARSALNSASEEYDNAQRSFNAAKRECEEYLRACGL